VPCRGARQCAGRSVCREDLGVALASALPKSRAGWLLRADRKTLGRSTKSVKAPQGQGFGRDMGSVFRARGTILSFMGKSEDGVSAPVVVESTDSTPIALWRSGTGPALLAVHGTAADHSSWDAVAALLEDAFTVYRMDRRGRGASGDGADYSWQQEVDDVVSAVRALPAPVYLYGHSFGGAVALEAARQLPDLAGLVLYEGGLRPPTRFMPDESIEALERMIASGQRDEALSRFMLTQAGVSDDELAVMRASSAWPGRLAAAHTIPRELRAIRVGEGGELPAPPPLGLPVLVIVGSDGGGMRDQMLQMYGAMAKQIPSARVVSLTGQRHAAHQTAPNLLADALRRELLGTV
jgi:pimeloyl-ACP methyl ester carboxylesterase